MALSTKIPSTFDEINGELWSINKRVYAANVYPPKMNTVQFRVDLCFTVDVSFFLSFQREISELRWPIAAKLCHMIGRFLYLIGPTILGPSPAQKKVGGQKRAKFGSISDHFTVRSRLYPERIEISKIGKKTCDRERFLPRSAKKVR